MPRPATTLPRRPRSPAAGLTAARKAADALARANAVLDDPTITHPAEAAKLATAALTGGQPKTQEDFNRALITAARSAGLSEKFALALAQRLDRNPEFSASGVELTTQQLIGSLQDKLRLAIAHLDPVVMAAAGARDLTIIAGILIDKIRLLQDQPTQIVDTTVRQSLDQLWPALVAEAERRGLAIPSSRMVDVTPRLDSAQRKLSALGEN